MQLAFREFHFCFVDCPNDEVAMGKQSFGAFRAIVFYYFFFLDSFFCSPFGIGITIDITINSPSSSYLLYGS